MSTDELADELAGETDARPGSEAGQAPAPDWWHRDHPVFTALSGFFTGMLFVTAVPGAFASALRLLFTYQKAEHYFPFVALLLIVPVALLANRRSRRFGTYMVIGMVLTALVVFGVASLVLYFMVRIDG